MIDWTQDTVVFGITFSPLLKAWLLGLATGVSHTIMGVWIGHWVRARIEAAREMELDYIEDDRNIYRNDWGAR